MREYISWNLRVVVTINELCSKYVSVMLHKWVRHTCAMFLGIVYISHCNKNLFTHADPVHTYCSVLQNVAVCWRVLQCVAVCCSVLQCVAVCCSVLQCKHFFPQSIPYIRIEQPCYTNKRVLSHISDFSPEVYVSLWQWHTHTCMSRIKKTITYNNGTLKI